MIMIRETTGLPPGGIQFIDSRTGNKFDEPGDFLKDVVNKVISLRLANPRLFNPVDDAKLLLFDFVKSEVAEQNCSRLGNNPLYCYETTYKPEMPKSFTKDKCDCNVPMQPVYCKTCGNSGRLVGYICPECKTQFEI